MSGDRDETLPSNARRLAIAGRAAVVAAVVLTTILGIACLAYLVTVASSIQQVQQETKRSADEVADCTTPKGVCYERGKQATADAVQQILDGVNQLEAQRNVTSGQLTQGQAQIRAALQRLCAAQNITCPSVTP